MKELIKEDDNQPLVPVFEAEIDGENQPAVDGRTLHRVMSVKRDFTNWIKRRIEKYQFQEGLHYLLANFGEQDGKHGGHNKVEYILTLNMAKELSMVEPTEMGRAARKYFIECERKLKQLSDADQEAKTDKDEDEEDEQLDILVSLFRDCVLFWALEKRDRIYQSGMDRKLLFSILTDFRASLSRELTNDHNKKFGEYSPEKFSEIKKFLKTWEPLFIREEKRLNKASENKDEK